MTELTLPGTESAHSESWLTVVVAFLANLLIAVAKSIAALVTGSASATAPASAAAAAGGIGPSSRCQGVVRLAQPTGSPSSSSTSQNHDWS